MCGIVGRLNFHPEPVSREMLGSMCNALAHRGPDDWGLYLGERIGLGSRRLSIIDLAGGHQPVCNEDETVWIVYNGEIYNVPELRQDLRKRGHVFRSNSDTEVIVHLYEDQGIECLQELNGMFAFAIWDERCQRLFLARDRLGKKPLVYALTNESITFASEIAAVLQNPAIQREVDPEALDLYLTLAYVPSPWTMLKTIRKLPAGHFLICERGDVAIRRYWDVHFATRQDYSETQAAYEVRTLLEDSVRRRLMSDVPLGAFLSGGIDSSTITAIIAQQSGTPVSTFSIGFDDDLNGELPYARQVARQYGTDHHEMLVRPRMVDVLPRLVHHYGEPFGDSSAVATYYLSQLASQSVKVALSGDGGDEVFGGYTWYVDASRSDQLARGFLRNGLKAAIDAWHNRRPRRLLGAMKGTAVGLAVAARCYQDPKFAFERSTTYFAREQRRQLYTPELRVALAKLQRPLDIVGDTLARQNGSHFLNRLFYVDHHLYLPDDILVKVDIASMANSLEVRCPFLDYRLVEMCASLAPAMKVRGGTTKRILRRAVADLVPEGILGRPKVGFALPVDRWMREDLRAMASDLLLDSGARSRSLFAPEEVRRLLERHTAGVDSNGQKLWMLLFFELWCREFLEAKPTREYVDRRAPTHPSYRGYWGTERKDHERINEKVFEPQP